MLLVVNPYATTVSNRLKKLVTYALRGRYEVDVVDTEGQYHAAQLAREAARDGYEIVVAFGGDGTVNEAANGLAGSNVPLAVLPGGCTNVVCRMLGIPNDIVDAAERLLHLADELRPRRIDLGRVNGRYFVSSSGVGLDADTVRRVDARPALKGRAAELAFAYAAVATFYRKYAGRPAQIVAEAGDERVEGVTAIVQNSDPFTYWGSRPLRVCDDAALDSGTLSMAVLREARQRDVPALVSRLFSGNARVGDHRQIESLTGLREARVAALARSGEPVPFPVQVDGDYIGDCTEAVYEIRPRALSVVA